MNEENSWMKGEINKERCWIIRKVLCWLGILGSWNAVVETLNVEFRTFWLFRNFQFSKFSLFSSSDFSMFSLLNSASLCWVMMLWCSEPFCQTKINWPWLQPNSKISAQKNYVIDIVSELFTSISSTSPPSIWFLFKFSEQNRSKKKKNKKKKRNKQ